VSDFGSAHISLNHGGSSMPAALAAKLCTDLPGWRCHAAYGLTETGQLTVLADEDYQYLQDGATGRPLPGVEVEVIDGDGRTCPPGEVGAVATRGPHVFEGYLGHHSVDPDGWFRTGDLGYVDERGLLFLVGRTKELIISGGLNVYAPEVENALSFHPAVEHVAVMGLPDDEWGEIVCAFVQVRDGQPVTAEELIAFARHSLAPYKKPRRVEFVSSFPLTAAGKIRKAALRDIMNELL
jgi:acyl-CoA synthetase (AMP-forming)/AMP-acid ligase II